MSLKSSRFEDSGLLQCDAVSMGECGPSQNLKKKALCCAGNINPAILRHMPDDMDLRHMPDDMDPQHYLCGNFKPHTALHFYKFLT